VGILSLPLSFLFLSSLYLILWSAGERRQPLWATQAAAASRAGRRVGAGVRPPAATAPLRGAPAAAAAGRSGRTRACQRLERMRRDGGRGATGRSQALGTRRWARTATESAIREKATRNDTV